MSKVNAKKPHHFGYDPSIRLTINPDFYNCNTVLDDIFKF